MSDGVATLTLEALLAHSEWVRRLARSLVRDPDTADEIAQQALLAAWRAPPRERDSLRAWLRSTLVRATHSARRSLARRQTHERRAARPESLPSALDVFERASLQRELVEAVFALDEPYRTAVLMRSFAGCSPAEIAQALGVPAATVRTRLARARVRSRLDRGRPTRARAGRTGRSVGSGSFRAARRDRSRGRALGLRRSRPPRRRASTDRRRALGGDRGQ